MTWGVTTTPGLRVRVYTFLLRQGERRTEIPVTTTVLVRSDSRRTDPDTHRWGWDDRRSRDTIPGVCLQRQGGVEMCCDVSDDIGPRFRLRWVFDSRGINPHTHG